MVSASISSETCGGGAAAGLGATVPPVTEAHTSLCFWFTAACSRTLGCTIVAAAVNCDPADQRPCSTQNTFNGNGSAPTGTMRSLPITQSCLPPLTSSPADRINRCLRRLIGTSLFTDGALYLCTAGRTTPRSLIIESSPCS